MNRALLLGRIRFGKYREALAVGRQVHAPLNARAGVENLRREGRPPERIHFVGNVMIDSLLWALPLAESSTILDRVGIGRGEEFALLTLHRPGNVDAAQTLGPFLVLKCEVTHLCSRSGIANFQLGNDQFFQRMMVQVRVNFEIANDLPNNAIVGTVRAAENLQFALKDSEQRLNIAMLSA